MRIAIATYILLIFGKTTAGGVYMDSQKQKKKAIVTDPFGSYTGVPMDANEHPIQDADDL